MSGIPTFVLSQIRLAALAGRGADGAERPHLVFQIHNALPDRLERLRELGLGEAWRDVLRAIPVEGRKPEQDHAVLATGGGVGGLDQLSVSASKISNLNCSSDRPLYQ
jgi:hypothetical protein